MPGMTHRRILFELCFILVTLGSSSSLLRSGQVWAKAPAQPKPNFVFILIDDLGWTDLGCYGSTFYRTPNLDRLAREGMRFTNAYAACPVCSPTRASIMTGKYPARLRLTDWLPGRGDLPSHKLSRPPLLQELPLEEQTLAEKLKSAGYVSASIGKWHLGGKSFAPEKQGFDLNVAGDHTGTPASYFFPYQNQRGSIPGLEKGEQGEYLTDRLTSEAERFIEKNQDKPFFLYLPHYAVHTPLVAKPQLLAKYQGEAKPGQLHNNPVYATMVESMDESVGRIVKKLEALGLADRTIIFFTSDNGGLAAKEGPNTPATDNSPLRQGKGYLYEGGIRVPWIVKWPGGVKPGSLCHTPVSSVDFHPTILEIAGIQRSQQTIDGVSIAPLLKQTGGLKRDILYWHYPHYSNQGGKPGAVVRQRDLKLIEFYEDNRLELYDLKQDLGEKDNLADRMPRKAAELQKKLAAWRKAVNAQMMTPNSQYQAAGQDKR
jgi:arylsulfatase A